MSSATFILDNDHPKVYNMVISHISHPQLSIDKKSDNCNISRQIEDGKIDECNVNAEENKLEAPPDGQPSNNYPLEPRNKSFDTPSSDTQTQVNNPDSFTTIFEDESRPRTQKFIDDVTNNPFTRSYHQGNSKEGKNVFNNQKTSNVNEINNIQDQIEIQYLISSLSLEISQSKDQINNLKIKNNKLIDEYNYLDRKYQLSLENLKELQSLYDTLKSTHDSASAYLKITFTEILKTIDDRIDITSCILNNIGIKQFCVDYLSQIKEYIVKYKLNADLIDQVPGLKEKISRYDSSFINLNNQNKQYIGRIEDLQKQINKLNDTNLFLKGKSNDFAKIQAENEKLKSIIDQIKNENQIQNKMSLDLNHNYDQLQQKFHTLNQQYENLVTQMKTTNQENSRLKNEISTLSRKYDDCNRKLSKFIESKDNSGGLCSICLDNKSEICYMPCTHICTCSTCNANIRGQCPYCNSAIHSIIKVRIV